MHIKPVQTRRSLCLAVALVVVFPICALCSAGLAQQSSPANDVSTVFQTASRAVVLVITSDADGKPIAQGSGFIVSSDGQFITNVHVIRGAASAIVKLPDGSFYEVEGVIGLDVVKDIAALKIRATGKEFPFLQLANTDDVKVGERVVAIGSPLALEGTVSDGIISAVRKTRDLSPQFTENFDVFQTTAPVSHGSSGGALLNLQGDAIAITSFGFVAGQNLNFAIPVSYARRLLTDHQVKQLTDFVASPEKDPESGALQLAGTYIGVWQSRLSGSGALVLTVSVDNGVLHANAVITGSPSGYRGDSMAVSNTRDMGNGVWTIELNGEHSKLAATGIFKPGMFTGDFQYKYSLFRPPDRGQWNLVKQ